MLQVWYAGFIVTVVSLAKLSGAGFFSGHKTVFYERGHHGPSLALTQRLADNFATTSADRSQKCHLDRTASSAALNLSESFWHWSHKSTLCQSSNFRLQTVWDGPSELHSIVSSGRSILAWRDLSYTFSQLQTDDSWQSRQEFPLNPFYFILFHSSAF